MGNIQSLIDIAVNRWPVLLATIVVCLAAVFGPAVNRTILLWGLPVVGDGNAEKRRMAYLSSAKKLYCEGYQKFKNGVFMITTSKTSPIIVISPRFLPELQKLPDSVVSMDDAIVETMEAKYTKIETSIPIMPHTIKGELTPSLNRLNPTIAQEVREAIQLCMPPCNDWTEVNINHSLLRIVGMASGRIFIGPELCRTEKYLDAVINYTIEITAAQRAVQEMRPWLRPFLASRLPAVKRLDQRIAEAEEFLKPIVKLRTEAMADPSAEKPDDMLQWLMNRKDQFPDKNSQNLAMVQLGVSFAAIHTTSMTATSAFYDLAALPELQRELRAEIQEAISQTSGVFTSQALQNMKKMDSFLKEVLRLHPISMAAFQRKVLQSFTLSNGQRIPKGVMIEIPVTAIHEDSDVFPNADKFDPMRFYKLRQQAKDDGEAEKAALHQFVSVNQSSLNFGYGRHACPGRFFAANEIKMILANAILLYDVRLIDATERYPHIEFAQMCIPDPSRKLSFKAREV